MGSFDAYREPSLRGGCRLIAIRHAPEPMADALNRPALARTTIIGQNLEIELSASLSLEETSVTLYHEVLEAASVAAAYPPAAVCELNEAGFELAAYRMHAELGAASPATLNRMLQPSWVLRLLLPLMDEQIRVELLKLAGGVRLLRLEHPASGLCLEKRLDASLPLLAQTIRWRAAFAALLARELLAA